MAMPTPIRQAESFQPTITLHQHIDVSWEFPVVFTKLSSCVTGPYDPVHRPRVSDQLDYEGELGFVIGRRCRHVSRGEAPNVRYCFPLAPVSASARVLRTTERM